MTDKVTAAERAAQALPCNTNCGNLPNDDHYSDCSGGWRPAVAAAIKQAEQAEQDATRELREEAEVREAVHVAYQDEQRVEVERLKADQEGASRRLDEARNNARACSRQLTKTADQASSAIDRAREAGAEVERLKGELAGCLSPRCAPDGEDAERCGGCGLCLLNQCKALKAEVERLKGELAVSKVTTSRSPEMDRMENIIQAQEASNVQLVEALKIGYTLSTFAASVMWDAKQTNTIEWLDGLREHIERFQPVAKQALAANEDSGAMGELLEAVRELDRIETDSGSDNFEVMDAAHAVIKKAKAAGVS